MIYTISTGILLTDDGEVILDNCYAGGDAGRHPEAVNNPSYCDQVNIGPLPPGDYGILPLTNHFQLGPSLGLVPKPGNRMFGRGGFFVHYNNSARDKGLTPYPAPAGRNSSDGCIVSPVPGSLNAVEARRASGDDTLTVMAGAP